MARQSTHTRVPKPLAGAHLLDNGGWWRTTVDKADPKRGEVHLYGPIGVDFFGDGVDANMLIEELEAMDVDAIDFRINSPGGSAWDGLNIANAIMRHKATVTSFVDGVAASAASMVMVAADKVVTSKYASAMLHRARGAAMSATADDMRSAAQMLAKLDESIASLYADRAGGEVGEWTRAMRRETWYNADEMVAAGLAHEIDTSTARDAVESAAASALALAPQQFYTYTGRQAAPAPEARASSKKGTGTMADKKDIAKSLGLPDDASDEDIRKALADAGFGPEDDQDDDTDGGDTTTDDADDKQQLVGAGAPQAKATGAADVVQLDKATYDSLVAGSQAGAKAMTTLQAQADARVVDTAIDEGRIMPSRRDHYLALMTADRGDTTDLLTKRLQPGVAVPLTENGHSVDADPQAAQAVTEDPKFKNWKVG
jgi:ATP-dependent protease ClpP protease subunit